MEDNQNKVVLQAGIHCKDCEKKITKHLKSYPGVEDVLPESDKVTVIGKSIDPQRLLEFSKKKTNNKVTKVLYPEIKEQKKGQDKTDEKKQVPLHCNGCIQQVKKSIAKIQDVHYVRVEREQVVVKGHIDGVQICKEIKKRTGKPAEVVLPNKEKEGQNDNEQGKQSSKEDKKNETSEYVFHGQDPNICSLM